MLAIDAAKYFLVFLLSIFNLNALAAELSLPQIPISNKTYVEPNVMLLMDTSGSMSWDLNGDIIRDNFTKSRMDIAKEVVSEIVGSTNHVDFCLARFTGREGGDILQACGASKTTITSAVTNLIAAGATPLAESYYEILRYFQGVSSAYQAKMHVSPIKYRCQKNYAIVFTDGLPTHDSNFPGAPASLPNYDNLAPATTTTNFPPYSDGFGGNVRVGGSTLYLDDFAKYAFETDFKDSTALDLAGVSYNNSDFPKQNMLTYTISLGFGEDSNGDTKTVQMLVDAAEYGQGQAYNANDAATLGQSLSSALAEISGASQSLAAVSSDSGSLQSGLTLYQNRYSSGDWRGELVALSIEETTVNGKITYALKTEPKWIAPIKTGSNKIKPFRKRVLFTGFKGGNKFNYNTFKNQPEFATWFDSEKSNINFLRGKVSSTGQRERELPMMGDVVNSAPVYVAGPKENLYTDTDPSFSAASEKYSEFYTQNKGRAAMLYHGANDGMLHGYEAAEGIERLGYFPEKVLPNLRHLISPTYQHQFYVDSTPMVDEAFNHVDNKWRTMLVSGLGRGGQGIFALDVTDPQFKFTKAGAKKTALWEFDDSVDADFGYSYSQPQIMRLNDGKFYVVVGNGYNNNENDGHQSLTGDGVLYLLNINDGSVFKKLSTSEGIAEDPSLRGIANGLAKVSGLDRDGDRKIDYIYSGDLFGNVWKFDLSDSDTSTWDVKAATYGTDGALVAPANPLKLFTACSGADNSTSCTTGTNTNHQSITSRVTLHKLNSGQYMVLFGTGKLLELTDADVSNVKTQTFYGIIDNGLTQVPRSTLLQQNVLYQGTPDGFNREQRLTTYRQMVAHKGWFINLEKVVPGSTTNLTTIINNNNTTGLTMVNEGEQVIASASVNGNAVTIFSKIASNTADPCVSASSQGKNLILNVSSGSRFDSANYDGDGNGVIDEKDGYKTDRQNLRGEDIYVTFSGQNAGNGVGAVRTNVVDSNGNNTGEVVVVQLNSDGGVVETLESIATGVRQSWREILNN